VIGHKQPTAVDCLVVRDRSCRSRRCRAQGFRVEQMSSLRCSDFSGASRPREERCQMVSLGTSHLSLPGVPDCGGPSHTPGRLRASDADWFVGLWRAVLDDLAWIQPLAIRCGVRRRERIGIGPRSGMLKIWVQLSAPVECCDAWFSEARSGFAPAQLSVRPVVSWLRATGQVLPS
jgi:hypothetical protein